MKENIVYVNKETMEIEAERTQFSKTFYVTDTERRLVASKFPMHVKEGKKWVDITCEIKNNKIIRSPYKGKLLKNKIGYQIDRGRGNIVEIELLNIKYKKPIINSNTVIWENIVQDIDLIINFTPTHAEFSRVLKTENADKSFDYRIVVKGQIADKVSFFGKDSNNKVVHLEQTEKSKKDVKRNGHKLVEKIITDTFIPEVTEMDEKTRKRYWSKDVKYPVIIH